MGAWFDTLRMLTLAMLFICCVTLPNMFIFASGSGIYDYNTYGMFTQFSLGNMGKIFEVFINFDVFRWS